DLLVVQGRTELGGTLEVTFTGDHVPAAGDTYVIVAAGERVGEFETVEVELPADAPDLEVAYGERAVVLRFPADGDAPRPAPRPALARSADLDGSGVTDVRDVRMLLAAWGPKTGPADLNRDLRVDGADLRILLNAWSP
ncbi:MAG: hypothetical protein ACYTG1_12305, partial [Planctomycetota bacterium]